MNSIFLWCDRLQVKYDILQRKKLKLSEAYHKSWEKKNDKNIFYFVTNKLVKTVKSYFCRKMNKTDF